MRILYKWLPMRIFSVSGGSRIFLYKWFYPCEKLFSISGFICDVRDDVPRPKSKSAQEWNTLFFLSPICPPLLCCKIRCHWIDSELFHWSIESLNWIIEWNWQKKSLRFRYCQCLLPFSPQNRILAVEQISSAERGPDRSSCLLFFPKNSQFVTLNV